MKTTNDSDGQSHDHEEGGDGDANIRRERGSASQNSNKESAILSYLKLVEQTFQNQTEKIDTFMEFLRKFNDRRMGPGEFLECVKELFAGHMDLINGFNAFLPEGFEITRDNENGATPHVDAHLLLKKIEERFQNDPHVYKSFLAIMKSAHAGSKDSSEALMEVYSLLADHPDLLEECNRFFFG